MKHKYEEYVSILWKFWVLWNFFDFLFIKYVIIVSNLGTLRSKSRLTYSRLKYTWSRKLWLCWSTENFNYFVLPKSKTTIWLRGFYYQHYWSPTVCLSPVWFCDDQITLRLGNSSRNSWLRQTTAIDDRSERFALAYNDLPCSSSLVKKCIWDRWTVIRQNDIDDHVASIATFKNTWLSYDGILLPCQLLVLLMMIVTKI